MVIYNLSRFSKPPTEAKYPCATLWKDRWNDFGYSTLYNLTWYSSKGVSKDLGSVKIYQRGKYSPIVPSNFERLDVGHCSLGQSLSYYEGIAELGHAHQDTLLRALRDVVFDPIIGSEFEGSKGFRTSLLRYSEAEKAYREGAAVLQKVPPPKGAISFEFEAKLPSAAAAHRVPLAFGDGRGLPDRIIAFIGKNGSGKTWLISRLAEALSGQTASAGKFTPSRPSFGRVVAVSYSAFDRFRKPKGKVFSYRYCGIYDEGGRLLTRSRQFQKVKSTHRGLAGKDSVRRARLWDKVISELFTSTDVTAIREYVSAVPSDEPIVLPPMSSGQLVLLTTLSELIANIDDEAMVLFDEPELHLHPNAIAGLMHCISMILDAFSSYAIIATHSPLIVQQIPAKYVRVFQRIKNSPHIQELGIESFGENLTTLTEEVFQASVTPSLFRSWAESSGVSLLAEELSALFPRGLSFSAKTFIETVKETDDAGGQQ